MSLPITVKKFILNRSYIVIFFALIAIFLGANYFSQDAISSSEVEMKKIELWFLIVRSVLLATLGYISHRIFFKDQRPDDMRDLDAVQDEEKARHYMLTRAIVMAGTLIGGGLAI